MWKRFVALLAIGLVAIPEIAAQQIPTAPARVRKGTVLKFATLKPLDSATAKVGDDVPLRLDRPLVVNGATLLQVGDLAYGRVTKVKRAGPNAREGEVKWKLERVVFHDSSTARCKVWFEARQRDTPVPDHYVHISSGGGDGGTTGEMVGLSIATIILAPFILLRMLFEEHGPYEPGTEYHLPVNSTVAVLISKDHYVRH